MSAVQQLPAPVAPRYTLADFESLPVGPPNYEYDEGEIVPVASPTLDHADIVDVIVAKLKDYARAHRSGRAFREIDVYLPDGKVFIPDAGFLSHDNLSLLGADGKIHGAPDLVVEITSSDVARDRIRKFVVYHSNGVDWYWIVDQDTLEIEEYTAAEKGYVLNSRTGRGETFRPALFPGMEINLAEGLGIESTSLEGEPNT